MLGLFRIIVDYKSILKASYKRRGVSCAVSDSCKTRDAFFAPRQYARIIDKKQEYFDSRDYEK